MTETIKLEVTNCYGYEDSTKNKYTSHIAKTFIDGPERNANELCVYYVDENYDFGDGAMLMREGPYKGCLRTRRQARNGLGESYEMNTYFRMMDEEKKTVWFPIPRPEVMLDEAKKG